MQAEARRPIWRGLRARLFLSYIAVAVVALGTLAVSAAAVAPSLFTSHMAGMMGAGSGAMGRMMAPGSPMPMAAMTAEAQASLALAFRGALNGALLYAALASLVAAVAASAFVAQRISVPVRRLARAARRIAAGHYAERVPSSDGAPDDELTELSLRFNEMAAALETTEQRRLRLVADVAHELRTPVATLKAYFEGLIDGVVKPDAGTFTRLHEEADRLGRLVDDLQELSRAEAGELSLRLRRIPPQEIAAASRSRLAPEFAAKGVALPLDVPPDLPPVVADLDRAVQVLTNLLANALRHTDRGGTVCVSARTAGAADLPAETAAASAAVEFSVADTGVGIAPEHLPHLFERFYRADAARSRVLGGAGIGLSISRALVEAMGGRIWAESAGTGHGATFRFTLATGPAAPAS